MHLLPQSFEFQTAHSSSQGTSVGTAALLLPVAVRFFSKSLPHLLPRRAFSFMAGLVLGRRSIAALSRPIPDGSYAFA
jgi:hypothetical protein